MPKYNAFFAYPSKPAFLAETVEEAIQAINSRGKRVINVISWVKLSNTGKVLISEICKEIEKCDLFMCDLSGLNHNVMFELGYAIARNKRIWITIDQSIPSNLELINNFDVLKMIGRCEHENYEDIVNQFLGEKPYLNLENTLLKEYSEFVPGSIEVKPKADILYLKSTVESTTSKKLTEFLSSLHQKITTDDPLEICFQPLKKYCHKIIETRITIAHLVSHDHRNHLISNAKYSLYAGMSLGFNSKLLMLAPEPFMAPIDYHDVLITYDNYQKCIEKTREWIYPVLFGQSQALSIIEPPPLKDPKKPKPEAEKLNLQDKLNSLKKGATLQLKTQEYPGPIILSRAVTLDGNGSTIWAHKGPVVSLKSSGVVLRNIKLECTDTETGDESERYAFLIESGLDCVFENVEVKGLVKGIPSEEGEWRYPSSISLGALLFGCEYRYRLRLKVATPCKLQSNISGVAMIPETLAPGIHEVELHLHHLPQDFQIRGSITIYTDLFTRSFSVAGIVNQFGKPQPAATEIPLIWDFETKNQTESAAGQSEEEVVPPPAAPDTAIDETPETGVHEGQPNITLPETNEINIPETISSSQPSRPSGKLAIGKAFQPTDSSPLPSQAKTNQPNAVFQLPEILNKEPMESSEKQSKKNDPMVPEMNIWSPPGSSKHPKNEPKPDQNTPNVTKSPGVGGAFGNKEG